MMNGAYSTRIRSAQNQDIIHLKNMHREERAEVIARSKKLQKETNLRRKAIAIKRKREAQLEEKRRQEILSKRKEHIREATERFQRLNRHYDPNDYTDHHPVSETGAGPTLEEALRAIRSSPKPPYRQGSASLSRQGSASLSRQGSASYGNQQAGYQPDSTQYNTTTNRIGSGGSVVSNERTREHARAVAARTELQSRSLRNLTNSRSMFEQELDQQHQLLIGQQQQSLQQFNEAINREMANDRKIQGLEEEEGPPGIARSDSLSSVDSLEAESKPHNATFTLHQAPLAPSTTTTTTGSLASGVYTSQPHSVHPTQAQYLTYTPANLYSQPAQSYNTNGAKAPAVYTSSAYSNPPPVAAVHTSPNSYATNPSGNFVVHRSSTSPSVAVVQPSVVHPSTYSTAQSSAAYVRDQPKQPMSTSTYSGLKVEDFTENGYNYSRMQEVVPGKTEPYGVITTGSNGRYNGHFYQDSILQYNVTAEPNNIAALQAQTNGHAAPKYEMETAKNGSGDATQSKTWATPIAVSTKDSKKYNVSTANRSLSNVPNPSVQNVATDQSSVIPHTLVTQSKSQNSRTPGLTADMSYTSPKAPEAVYKASRAPASSAKPVTSTNIITAPNSFHGIRSAAINTQQTTTTQAQNDLINSKTTPKKTVAIMETNTQDERSETDSDDVENESSPEPPLAPKVVKGILKKTRSAPPPQRDPPPHVRGGGYARRGLYSRSVSANASVRDSIEVTRQQISSRQESHKMRPKKKGVRWTDLHYTEESDSQSGEEPIEEQVFEAPPVNRSIKQSSTKETLHSTPMRPSRPISAKVSTVTAPAADQSMKAPRSSSAGTQRRGPFLRPHPPSHPPSGRATVGIHQNNRAQPSRPVEISPSKIPIPATNTTTADSNHGYNSNTYTTPATTTPVSNGGSDVAGAKPETRSSAVFNASGLRLDRTPTDDEINWLWDKVRTCLHRESSSSSITPDQGAPRPVHVSQKYIDGNSLKPHVRASYKQSNMYQNNYMGASNPIRKKVTMETLNNYANRRSSLLAQRRQQPNTGSISHHTANDESIQPIPSSTGPNPTVPTFTDQDVSESMAAFLTAELLAQQAGSMSESQIEQAMDMAQQRQQTANAGRPQQKVTSALSIEEQRLMQSLDRLNDKLRITEQTSQPTFVPRPPAVPLVQPGYGSFKGRAPLSATTRRQGLNANGTVPRQQFRAGSAHNSFHRYR